MKKQDQVGGLIWLAIGIFLCVGSLQLGIGKIRTPGAGFLPLLSGSLVVILGSILTLKGFLRGRVPPAAEKAEDRTGLRAQWNYFRLPLIILATLLVYIQLMGYLGFALTTFLWLFLLFKLGDPAGWLKPLLFSFVFDLVSYLIFVVWLQLQLPKGVLGF